MDNDTAKGLREMFRSLDHDLAKQISEQVDPAVLFEIEEVLGTIPEPRRGVPLHGMQQVMAIHEAVDESIRETIDAVAREAGRQRLCHEIVEAVMADPRVVSAMEAATRAKVVDGAVPIANQVMREELARRGLARP